MDLSNKTNEELIEIITKQRESIAKIGRLLSSFSGMDYSVYTADIIRDTVWRCQQIIKERLNDGN